MSGVDFRVPALSWDDIHRHVENLREKFGLAHEPYFPIIEFIERVLDQKLGLLTFCVGDLAGMDGAEGLTEFRGTYIMLREDVYRGAVNGFGRPRFTAAHELGHWVLHTNLPMARAEPKSRLRDFERSEPQANQFAAELLMPRDFIHREDTPASIVERHGVSFSAAKHRLDYLLKRGLLD